MLLQGLSKNVSYLLVYIRNSMWNTTLALSEVMDVKLFNHITSEAKNFNETYTRFHVMHAILYGGGSFQLFSLINLKHTL